MQHALVRTADFLEASIDEIDQAFLPAAAIGLMRFEESRCHHRRQSQCDDRRNRDRTDQGKREFGKQCTGQAALESDRHVHRDQHDGHRDNRPRQFSRRHQRCLAWRQALLDMSIDVFDHDDGVIHDQSDGKYQRQQGQQIDRESERQHHRECADQRQRNRNQRDQDRTRRTEEREHDKGHDQQGFEQRVFDFGDRAVDELGSVVDDFAGDAVRQLRLHLRKGRTYAVNHVEQVRRRRYLDANVDGFFTVEGHARFVVFRTQRDIRHVLQTHDRAITLLDNQLAKFVERAQVGRCGEIDLNHLALAIAQARKIIVVRQRRADIGCGEAVRRQFFRIEPDPQREQFSAQQFGGLHAFERLQFRLYHTRQIIGDLVRREHFAGKTDVHRVDGLADFDRQHRLLRARRQLIQHRVDLGIDLGEGLVGIVIQTQVGGDRARAAAAVRYHVVDAVRLGDGIFQRRGNEARDQIRIGTVIRGADRDHRVLRIRILQYRQAGDRAQTEHQNHQADHGRQHRAANKDIGEIHGCAPFQPSLMRGFGSLLG